MTSKPPKFSFPNRKMSEVEQAILVCEHVIELSQEESLQKMRPLSNTWLSEPCVFHPDEPDNLCFYQIQRDLRSAFISLLRPGATPRHLFCVRIAEEDVSPSSHFPIKMLHSLRAKLAPEAFEKRQAFEKVLSAAIFLSGIEAVQSTLIPLSDGHAAIVIVDNKGVRYTHTFEDPKADQTYLEQAFHEHFSLGSVAIGEHPDYNAPYLQVLTHFKPRIFNSFETMLFLGELGKGINLTPPDFARH